MPHFRHLAGLLLLVLWLGGCAGVSGPPPEEPEPEEQPRTDEPAEAVEAPGEEDDDEPATEEDQARAPDMIREPPGAVAEEEAEALREQPRGFSRETLYRLLVADLAGRQGDLDTALQGYMETAAETRDPRVAERATRLALYAGDNDQALVAARRWLELAPDALEAHSIAARLYLRRGEPGPATEHLERVIELTEGGLEAGLREAAVLATRSSNAEAALAAMRRLQERHPGHAVTHYAIGDLADSLDDPETALTALNRALEIDPAHSDARVLRARIWLQAGEEQRALDDLRAARERFPEDRDLALGSIRLLVASDRDEAAREAIQQAFETWGDDSFAVHSLALLAMQIAAWDDARIYLERLLAMDERTATAHYYLGRIAEQEADCTTALRHYIRVGNSEHRFDAELRAAECMARLGRVNEARVHLERLRNQYDDTGTQVRIVMTLARIEQLAGNAARALSVLTEAVDRHPDHLDLRYTRALTAAEQDRFALAREDLEFILAQQPDNARALNALGYMLADRNQELERARGMIERALKQNPEDAATIDSMGWVLYRQGHHEQALEYLRDAWARDPDPEIAAHLGEVLWTLGRHEQAREIWDEAAEIAPDSEILRETVERLTQ